MSFFQLIPEVQREILEFNQWRSSYVRQVHNKLQYIYSWFEAPLCV